MQGALKGIVGSLVHIRMQPFALDVYVACAIVHDQINRHCTVSLLQQARIAACQAPMDTSDDELESFSLDDDQACISAHAAGFMPRALCRPSGGQLPVGSYGAEIPTDPALPETSGMGRPQQESGVAYEGPRPDAIIVQGGSGSQSLQPRVLGALGTCSHSFRPASLTGQMKLTGHHVTSIPDHHACSMSQQGWPTATQHPHITAHSDLALHGAVPISQAPGVSASVPTFSLQGSFENPNHAAPLRCIPSSTWDAELDLFDCTQLPLTESSFAPPLEEEILLW